MEFDQIAVNHCSTMPSLPTSTDFQKPTGRDCGKAREVCWTQIDRYKAWVCEAPCCSVKLKGRSLRLQWGRSSEGYCESKCGRFSITPHYCGTTRPRFFTLVDGETKREYGCNASQRDCKQKAQQIADGVYREEPVLMSEEQAAQIKV